MTADELKNGLEELKEQFIDRCLEEWDLWLDKARHEVLHLNRNRAGMTASSALQTVQDLSPALNKIETAIVEAQTAQQVIYQAATLMIAENARSIDIDKRAESLATEINYDN